MQAMKKDLTRISGTTGMTVSPRRMPGTATFYARGG